VLALRSCGREDESSNNGSCGITEYAEQLVADIKQIENAWPEKVLKRQRDWVGRSEGAYIDFAVKDSDKKIRVFTTRIDTIYGATAIAIAASIPLRMNMLEGSRIRKTSLLLPKGRRPGSGALA
jgi:leucyl-tRNA synthetase